MQRPGQPGQAADSIISFRVWHNDYWLKTVLAMQEIAQNLLLVRRQIAQWEIQYQRSPGSVSLIAVSKTHGAENLRQAYQAGQRAFGESYLQEALQKMQALTDCDIQWHFIGPLQSNKTRPIAQAFDWVHSVDRLKIAQRLHEQRPSDLGPLNICIQVNISGESSKSGVLPGQLPALLEQLAPLHQLRIRGIMAIPAANDKLAAQRQVFRRLNRLFEEAKAHNPGLALDTLSMGMSSDMQAAIAEGATMVRVGTAIFGER